MASAILYSRFSSSQQSSGDSLRRQLEAAQKFCSLHGLELSETTFQDLGISGWKDVKRDGLERLIEAVESGAIPNDSYILVEHTDRLSRQGWQAVSDLVKRLVDTGCSFVTIDNGVIYNKETFKNFTGAIPILIAADLAVMESEKKSERLRAVKTNKRNNRVIQGNQPFWITVTDGKPYLNDKAPLARRIVDMSLSGKRPLAIVREFNTEGLESINGGIWQVAVIRNILKNTILYGAKTYFESRDGKYEPVETVAGLYPKICSLQEFNQIKVVSSGQKGRKQIGPFSTILRCSCGRPLINKGKRNDDTYRVCAGVIDGTCTLKGYYRNIDDIIMSQLEYIEVPETKPSTVINNDARISELEQLLIDLDVMRVENKGKPRVLQMVFDSIDEAEKELQELQSIVVVDTQIDLKSVASIEDVDKQNMVLRSIIRNISCKKISNTKTHVRIDFKTGFTKGFMIDQGRKIDGYAINWKSDSERLLKEMESLGVEEE